MSSEAPAASSAGSPAGLEHCPEDVARGLAAKISSRARHVCLLLGAGASCAAGLPTLADLQAEVLSALKGEDRDRVAKLLDRFNLEEVISRLRGLQVLLDEGEELGGLTAKAAASLDTKICQAIITAVDSSNAPIDAFSRLATWANRMDSQTPIELFTINYDLLIERGLEQRSVPYFDGFIGGVEAPFIPELVEPGDAPPARSIPSGFVRLWKLHGSTSWRTRIRDKRRITVRVSDSDAEGAAVIYPSNEKYDDARRVPFVVLMDRFRRALSEPETITLAIGYSFSDEHLNEILFDAARRYPRSELVALCFRSIPDNLAREAADTRNILVTSPDKAIVNGHLSTWRGGGSLPGVFENGEFMLGEFGNLAAFLSRQIG